MDGKLGKFVDQATQVVGDLRGVLRQALSKAAASKR